jgi:predicted nucleic acid-binding protein
MQGYGENPLSNQMALDVYKSLISQPVIGWLDEPADMEKTWFSLADHPMASPKLWMDAYLAAMAIAGDHELVTFDQAFRQFPGLRLIPLN